MQGKRDNNEDRAIMKTVRMLEEVEDDDGEVHVWAVMDGHGGQVQHCDEIILTKIFSCSFVQISVSSILFPTS